MDSEKEPIPQAPLTFEEFKARQNNFHLHFAGVPGDSWFGDRYRKERAFTQCLAKNPAFAALAESLYEYRSLPDPDKEQRLYRAYLMMRPYAEKDWELFQ